MYMRKNERNHLFGNTNNTKLQERYTKKNNKCAVLYQAEASLKHINPITMLNFLK